MGLSNLLLGRRFYRQCLPIHSWFATHAQSCATSRTPPPKVDLMDTETMLFPQNFREHNYNGISSAVFCSFNWCIASSYLAKKDFCKGTGGFLIASWLKCVTLNPGALRTFSCWTSLFASNDGHVWWWMHRSDCRCNTWLDMFWNLRFVMFCSLSSDGMRIGFKNRPIYLPFFNLT